MKMLRGGGGEILCACAGALKKSVRSRGSG